MEFGWQSDWPVHQLWPPPEGKQRTELDVVLFHGLQLTANGLVMPGVAHGHNEVMMMYVGLENGCRLIWGKLCAFSPYHTMHM